MFSVSASYTKDNKIQVHFTFTILVTFNLVTSKCEEQQTEHKEM